MTLALAAKQILGEPWAIAQETLQSLAQLGTSAYTPRPAAMQRRPAIVRGDPGFAAIIQVRGIITHRESLASLFGGTSIERLTQQFRRALNERGVQAIVLDVDSPGGEVAGIPELADEIFRSRSKKKLIGCANATAIAGAFWLAAMASELVVTESGELGSIGIAVAHEDYSVALKKAGINTTFISAGKYKTDGNAREPLSDSARSDIREKVDAFHSMFVSDVARGRGVRVSTVREKFGEGRTVLARRAVALGMADRIGTIDQEIARLRSGRDETAQDLAGRLAAQREEFGRAGSARRSISQLRRELELL